MINSPFFYIIPAASLIFQPLNNHDSCRLTLASQTKKWLLYGCEWLEVKYTYAVYDEKWFI